MFAWLKSCSCRHMSRDDSIAVWISVFVVFLMGAAS